MPELWVNKNGVWVKPGSNQVYGNNTVAEEVWANNAGTWTRFFVNEIAVTISAHAAQINVQNYFSSTDWAGPAPKILNITNGAHIWSYTQGVPALNVGTGRGGTLTINVGSGCYILGHRGARNSGVGGTAVYARQATIINNAGGIYGGGGGGGRGGQGGPGYYYTARTIQEGPAYSPSAAPYYYWAYYPFGGNSELAWGSSGPLFNITGNPSTYTSGGWTYRKNTLRQNETFVQSWEIYRTQVVNDVYNATTGGAGGTGGEGAGYDSALVQQQESGFGGAAGGTNAGTGGTGGTGGGWGATGNTGNTGASGNAGGGSAGSAGGAAGYYLDGNAYVTWTATGTRLGRLA